MGLCADCKFFVPTVREGHSGSTPLPVGFGRCERWHTGYGAIEMTPNEVRVEDDEGWGMRMGPEFGCVLFQPKQP